METNNTLAEWLVRLNEPVLPMMKNSRKSLDGLGSLENQTLVKISNIVLTDPGLIITMLRSAAEKPKRALQGDIRTVDNAIMMLGMKETGKTIDSLPIIEESLDGITLETYMTVVNRCYHSAYQAFGMAKNRFDLTAEEIFAASMLQEIGTLMLLVHGNGLLVEKNLYSDLSNQKLQIERLGFSLRELSGQLLKQWGLSSFICESLAPLDDPITNQRLQGINLAHRLGIAAEVGWETEETQDLITELASYLNVAPEKALLEVSDNALHSADETTFYGITPAAASLPELDEETRQSINAAVQSRTTAQTSPLDKAALRDVFVELEKLTSGQPALDQLMAALKIGFQLGLGANRAFFSMLSKDRTELITRYIFGADKSLRDLRIPLNQNNLFQRLLKKPQSMWANEENRNNIIPLIPDELYMQIDTNHFFLSSIEIKNKVLGVVYVDRYKCDVGLDEASYIEFQKLCKYLAKGFVQLNR